MQVPVAREERRRSSIRHEWGKIRGGVGYGNVKDTKDLVTLFKRNREYEQGTSQSERFSGENPVRISQDQSMERGFCRPPNTRGRIHPCDASNTTEGRLGRWDGTWVDSPASRHPQMVGEAEKRSSGMSTPARRKWQTYAVYLANWGPHLVTTCSPLGVCVQFCLATLAKDLLVRRTAWCCNRVKSACPCRGILMNCSQRQSLRVSHKRRCTVAANLNWRNGWSPMQQQ